MTNQPIRRDETRAALLETELAEAPLTFDTLAALQAWTPGCTRSTNNRLIHLKGRSAAGDGLGGLYIVRRGGGSTDSRAITLGDGITQAIPVRPVDPTGLSFSRTCAEFLPGIAGSQQRCSFSFDPTNTTDLTIRFKRRGLSRQAADASFAGLGSTDRPHVRYNYTAPSTYAVEMCESSTALLAYAWTDDLEWHEWEFRYASTGCTILLDGVSVATGSTPGSFLDTSFVFGVGNGATGATNFGSDHALYRDFEVIDPATATNKVYLRLDEGAGGPYRNAYLTPGDPLYDATNTSGVTVCTQGTMTQYPGARICQTLDGGDRPAVARRVREHNRVAAFGGLGDNATAGHFGIVTWAPTGTPAFNFEMTIARSITQGGTLQLIGRDAAGYARVNISSAGVLTALEAANTIATSPAVIPADGRPRRVRFEFRTSGADVTAAIYVDGTLVASGTRAATSWSTVAAFHYLGAASTGVRRFSGTIYDVLIEDMNSASNSGFYLMDEALTATSYANSYPTATLAGLTKNGYVGVTSVVSTDGRGMPWQPMGPLVYSAYRSADTNYTGGTIHTLIFDFETSDPTGSFNTTTGLFTAPCPGLVALYGSVGITGTTLAGATQITANGLIATGYRGASQADFAASGATASMAVVAAYPVTTGDTAGIQLSDVLAGDTWTLENRSSILIIFTPTPQAG